MKRGGRKEREPHERERRGQERCFEIKVNEPVRAGCTRRQFAFEGFPRPFNWNQIGIQLAPAPRDYARLMLDGALVISLEKPRSNLTLPFFQVLSARAFVLYVLPSLE